MLTVSSELGKNLIRAAAEALTVDGLLAFIAPSNTEKILPPHLMRTLTRS
jgi:16S rRNA G1207 methylase RsmC